MELPPGEICDLVNYIHLRNKFNMFSPAVKREMLDEVDRIINNEALIANMYEMEYWEDAETAGVLAGILKKYLRSMYEI